MSSPTRECPNCGKLMVCIQDEPMGRTYWCGFCLHEEAVPFDKHNVADFRQDKGEANAA